MTYTLDDTGNRTSAADESGGVTTYTYDDLYQLTGVEYPGGQTVAYAYDPAGNRVSAAGVTSSYDDANRLIQAGDVAYGYDVNGNLISVGEAVYYGYDYENRLVSYTGGEITVQYSYDGDGNRLGQSVSGSVYGSYEYIYDINEGLPRILVEKDNSGNENNYIYGGRLLSRIGPGGQVFYHQDGLGSISVISDVYGNTLNRYAYDAFGGPRSVTESVYNNIRFTGEPFDASGLVYLRARYYDPATGRFISRDTLFGDLGDPLSQNLYAYCGNNPVLYTDPSGNIKICQYDDLYWGMGASLGDTLRDLVATPDALMELARAVKSGQLSVEDLRQALGDAFEPLRYVASTSGLVWFGEPTDKQVYEYGRNLGATLQMAAGGAGGAAAAKVISKAAPRLAKALERLVKGNKGTGKAAWGMWSDLEKVTYSGREYASINGRLYTREAVDRMTPRGYGTAAGGYPARGIPPSVVEDVITNGVSRQVTINNEARTIFELNDIRVVTVKEGKIVITTYPY